MEYYNDLKNTAVMLTNTGNWEANKMTCQNSQSALIIYAGLEMSCIFLLLFRILIDITQNTS